MSSVASTTHTVFVALSYSNPPAKLPLEGHDATSSCEFAVPNAKKRIPITKR